MSVSVFGRTDDRKTLADNSCIDGMVHSEETTPPSPTHTHPPLTDVWFGVSSSERRQTVLGLLENNRDCACTSVAVGAVGRELYALLVENDGPTDRDRHERKTSVRSR